MDGFRHHHPLRLVKINANILIHVIRDEFDLEAVAEHRFHPSRKWRFDLAIPEMKIAIELEGGVFTNGRHTRGQGYVNDCEKYNAANVLGWNVLRYVHSKHTYTTIVNDLAELFGKREK